MNLLSFFSPPVFDDPESQRTARLLHGTSCFVMVAVIFCCLLGLLFVPANAQRWILGSLALIGMSGLSLRLLSQAKLQLASWAFVLQLWLIVSILVMTSGGMNAPGLGGYIPTVLAAALFIGWRGGALVAGVCFVTVLGILVAQIQGVLPASAISPGPVHYWVGHTLVLSIVMVLVYYYSTSLTSLIQQVQSELVERRKIEDKNKNIMIQLDERVKELTCLHRFGLILREEKELPVILNKLLALLPPAFQFPELIQVHIQLGQHGVQTASFQPSRHCLRTEFVTHDQQTGMIEVVYSDTSVSFLSEEEQLLKTLAEMLRIDYDQRLALEALSNSNEQLRALFAAMDDVVMVLDAQGRYLQIAPTKQTWLNQTPEAMLGKTLHDILPPEKARLIQQQIDKAFETQAAVHLEYSLVIDGQEVWFYGTVSPFTQESVLWIGRDISVLKESEALIQSQEERYRELVETAPDIIYTQALDGSFVSLNPAFEKVLGWPCEHWLGKSYTTLIYPNDLPLAQELVARLLSGQAIPLTELRINTQDGEYAILEFTAVPQMNGSDVIGILGIGRDISARKKLEEQLRRTQRVESLGTLVGGIAHDLNNMLTPIMLSIDMLEMRIADPALKKLVATLSKGTSRGAQLVKQILTFARGSNQDFSPQLLRQHLEDMASFIQQTFPKNIHLVVEMPEQTWPVLGEPTQFHQVLLNLCVNARDAMSQGGTLTLRLENKDIDSELALNMPPIKAGKYVLLSVSDTGEGIPPDIQNLLFEAFFTTKEEGKGTGLGLAMVQEIVKEHKGFIQLHSVVGQGSTFQIYWPAVESASVTLSETFSQPLLMGQGEHLLVVDDERTILNMTKEILETYGYQVTTAVDGLVALNILAEQNANPIQLVLTDMHMPNLDGQELLKRLQKIRPELPLIAATGSMNEHALDLEGVGEILTKPYSTEVLLKAVDTALHNSRFV
ncbi:MAG: PAS domain S-box protein [Candidatus Sericytochromatia bacterium]